MGAPLPMEVSAQRAETAERVLTGVSGLGQNRPVNGPLQGP